VVDRVNDLDAVLVTRYLDFSVSYARCSPARAVTSRWPAARCPGELIARLHLVGFFWGDCSLSNTLFRLDAAALSRYLVDVETVRKHDQLSDGSAHYDIALARTNVAGELFDLEAAGTLPAGLDVVRVRTRSRCVTRPSGTS
jgi:hypothetical protein